MVAETAQLLSITDIEVPFPTSAAESSTAAAAAAAPAEAPAEEPETVKPKKSTKRKSRGKAAAEEEAEAAAAVVEEDEEAVKKAKTTEEELSAPTPIDPRQALARTFLGMLDPESLKPPTMPTPEEMSQVLLEVRKKALREEYGV